MDLEADHASFAGKFNIFKDKESIHRVLKTISDRGVPITVFVVGKVIEDYPEIVEIFKKYNFMSLLQRNSQVLLDQVQIPQGIQSLACQL